MSCWWGYDYTYYVGYEVMQGVIIQVIRVIITRLLNIYIYEHEHEQIEATWRESLETARVQRRDCHPEVPRISGWHIGGNPGASSSYQPPLGTQTHPEIEDPNTATSSNDTPTSTPRQRLQRDVHSSDQFTHSDYL